LFDLAVIIERRWGSIKWREEGERRGRRKRRKEGRGEEEKEEKED
jgi:hypothetical protein